MVILQGTTGEWPSLTMAERLGMAKAWREAVPAGSRMKLIMHVGHDNLQDAKSLALAAVDLAMDSVLVSAPSKYIAPDLSSQADAVADTLQYCGDLPAFYCAVHCAALPGLESTLWFRGYALCMYS